MLQDEFVKRMLGVKWVNRKGTFSEVDCYGLVMLYYKEVLGVELSDPIGYKDLHDVDSCLEEECAGGGWAQVERPAQDGTVAVFFLGERAMHVGLMVGRKVLHCRGSITEPGQVEIHSLRTLMTNYTQTKFFVRIK
jgi:cell wall-associated NlpC family hydrolase